MDLPGPLDTLNPLLSRSPVWPALATLLFPGLVATDAQGRYVPALADRWQSDDGQTWNFHLGVRQRWQDGVPVSSADVTYTISLLRAPQSAVAPALRQAWQGVQVSAPDSQTVVLTLPGGLIQSGLALATLPVLPAHLLAAVPATQLALLPFSSHPVGSGPYQVSASSSQEVTMERVAADSVAPKRLTLRFSDRSPVPASTSVRWLGPDGAATPPERVTRLSLAKPVLLFLNVRRPPLDEVVVRRTLAAVINRAALPGASGCPAACCPIPSAATRTTRRSSSTSGLPDQATGGAAPGPDVCLTTSDRSGGDILPWASPLPLGFWVAGSLVPGSDPQAAGAALERSGWVLGGDGTRRRDGATLTLTLLVDDDSRRLAVAQFVANAWRGIGIQATVEAVGLDGLVRDFALPGRYDALLLGVRGNDARPPLAELWHTNGALNLSGWSDPVADAAIEATNAADAATEELGYERFSRQFADQVPGIPLYLPTARFAANGVALSPWLLADEADILRGAQSWQPLGLGPPA